ncbi:MAG: hypothetical protein V9F02_10670 [Chitinophagaceae bacterium]
MILPIMMKDENEGNSKSKAKDDEAVNDYKGQFAMYYARILFFAFLTDSRVKSLQEIINHIKDNADNFANSFKFEP